MPLTGTQSQQLRDALLAGFDQDGLVEMMQFDMNVHLFQAIPEGSLETVAFNLVNWCDAQGRVGELLNAMAARRPKNTAVQKPVADLLKALDLPSGVGGPVTPAPAHPNPPPRGWRLWWLRHQVAATIAACFAAVLLVVAVIALAWPDNNGGPPPEHETTVVKIQATLQTWAEGGPPTHVPLAGAVVTVKPHEFSAAGPIVAPQTDAHGRCEIRVTHPPLGGRAASFHFLVDEVPDHLKSLAPLVPLTAGAYRLEGGYHELRVNDQLEVRSGQEVRLIVVPYRDWRNTLVPRQMADGANDKSKPPALTSQELAAQTGLPAADVEAALKWMAQEIAGERPAAVIPEDLSKAFPKIPNWTRVAEVARTVAGHVCYAVLKHDPWWSVGFVIAEDTVVVFGGQDGAFTHVGFGPTANAPDDRRFPVHSTLFHDNQSNLSLLHVPGLPAPARLELAASSPFGDQRRAGLRVAVFGYPSPDPRVPNLVRAVHIEGGVDRKRVMPGDLLGFVERNSQLTPLPLKMFASTLRHDALTSGGAGGGPVVDVDTGLVVGIHVGGSWEGVRKVNNAIPIWELLTDPRVKPILEQRGVRVKTPRPAAQYATADFPAAGHGYDEEFLPGFRLPLTRPPNQAAGGLVLDYEHFSVVMGHRGFARLTACNIDRARLVVIRGDRDPWGLDPRIPLSAQLGHELYTENEWDRGHLVRPRNVAWGDEEVARRAYRHAFTYTNVTPQHIYFNQQTWAALEDHVLRGFYPEARRLTVFNGPVLRDTDYPYRGTRIPRSFWMIAVAENTADPARPHVKAWLVPQYEFSPDGVLAILPGNRQFATFETTVAKVAEVTGLSFGPLKD